MNNLHIYDYRISRLYLTMIYVTIVSKPFIYNISSYGIQAGTVKSLKTICITMYQQRMIVYYCYWLHVYI